MKKAKPLLLTFICYIIVCSCFSQNLVPNYSFEVYDTCPMTHGPIENVEPWVQPSLGSSDYYNSCTPHCGFICNTVPENAGGYQYAKDGNAYAGIILYCCGSPNDTTQYNNREYLQVKLLDTLEANKCYRLKLFVSIGDSVDYYKITNFGAYFSDTAILDTTTLLLNYTPQINYIDVNGIGDIVGWYKIESTFLAAGGEQYMTLGNFNDDAHTTRIKLDTSITSFPGHSYYYVDSVSLTQILCPIGISINEFSDQKNIFVYPNPAKTNLHIVCNLNDVEIIINDVWGGKIKQLTLENQTSIDIDISNFSSGVYFITFIDKKNFTKYLKKFVVIN